DQVIASKNDNDPRLEHELKNLTQSAKRLMVARYHSLAQEKLNERGTIVFLIGREIRTTEDLRFLHEVLNEPPCLSLAHCDRDNPSPLNPEDQHLESANETTQLYPQIVALKELEKFLNLPKRSGLLESKIRQSLEEVMRSPTQRLAIMAE